MSKETAICISMGHTMENSADPSTAFINGTRQMVSKFSFGNHLFNIFDHPMGFFHIVLSDADLLKSPLNQKVDPTTGAPFYPFQYGKRLLLAEVPEPTPLPQEPSSKEISIYAMEHAERNKVIASNQSMTQHMLAVQTGMQELYGPTVMAGFQDHYGRQLVSLAHIHAALVMDHTTTTTKIDASINQKFFGPYETPGSYRTVINDIVSLYAHRAS